MASGDVPMTSYFRGMFDVRKGTFAACCNRDVGLEAIRKMSPVNSRVHLSSKRGRTSPLTLFGSNGGASTPIVSTLYP